MTIHPPNEHKPRLDTVLRCDQPGCTAALPGRLAEKAAVLRQRARGAGWAYKAVGPFDNRRVDLCPEHRREATP